MQVTPDMLISDVLTKCPGAAEVFERYDLGCGVCFAASMESLSAVAGAHGVALDELIADLNREAETAATAEKES